MNKYHAVVHTSQMNGTDFMMIYGKYLYGNWNGEAPRIDLRMANPVCVCVSVGMCEMALTVYRGILSHHQNI